MRAVQIRTFGEPRIVLELADLPEPPAQAAGEVLIGVSFLRRTLSPRLSLAGRDPIHSAVTDRHFIHEAPTEQLVEKMDNAGDPRQDLTILVSAVQSRPCPPVSQPVETPSPRWATIVESNPVILARNPRAASSVMRSSWRQRGVEAMSRDCAVKDPEGNFVQLLQFDRPS